MSIGLVFFLFVAVSAIGFVFAFAGLRSVQGRRRNILADAAGRLGLQVVEGAEALEQMAVEAEAAGQPAFRLPAGLPPVLSRAIARLVGPCLTGTYRGVRVSVRTESHSSGSGSRTETVFKAWYAKALPFDFHMSKEGVGAKIAKTLGGQDVEIGEPAFDAAVRVRTNDPAAVRSWFYAAARRQATVAAVSACPGLRASRTCVTFSRQGSARSSEEVVSVLEAIAPLAAALGDASR